MRRSLVLLCLVATALMAGCSSAQYRPDLIRAQINAPYLLASGDRVRVIVFGQDSLSNSFAVDGAGNVSIPLIGLVRAYGLTTADLGAAIAARLRQGYLRDPRVSVEVEAFRPFFVLGEVTTAGQYPFINGMTVQNAVAVAGGFTPRGAPDYVVITRVVDGQPVSAEVPLGFPLRPGDTITAKERFF